MSSDPSPLPSPEGRTAWTPDQPLPHPLTDEQFAARWDHLLAGVSDFGAPWRVALRLAREVEGAAPALPVGRTAHIIRTFLDAHRYDHGLTDEEIAEANSVLASLTGGEPSK